MEETKAKASTIAKNKYNAKNYDNLRIVVKKGAKLIYKHTQNPTAKVSMGL